MSEPRQAEHTHRCDVCGELVVCSPQARRAHRHTTAERLAWWVKPEQFDLAIVLGIFTVLVWLGYFALLALAEQVVGPLPQ